MERELEITVNTQVCTGCRICEMVCSLYHEKVINKDKARIRVSDNWDESLYEPHICQLCESPECVAACPMSALTQDDQGIIHVDTELCSGCATCVEACPNKAILWSDEFERLFICDRCGGDPTCVKFCTVNALVSKSQAAVQSTPPR
jgi:carbon-monoxide dehydrogenase iron sulfur subunit